MEAGDEALEMVDSKDLQQQSKALDKLTDHVEDRQLDSSRVQTVPFYPYSFHISHEPMQLWICFSFLSF